MLKQNDRRRVLVAACSTCAHPLHALFAQPVLERWDVLSAESLSQARFLLQHSPCDVLLVSSGLVEHDGCQGLAWLAQRGERPIVFLSGGDADSLTQAYRYGIDICVPQQLAVHKPELLAAALDRALAASKVQRQQRHLKRQMQTSRRHVDRLVGLIWRTTPGDPTHHWYPQRFAMERLQEELARTKRHGVPLSVAIGAVDGKKSGADNLEDWLAAAIGRVKRRSDVAGQYGVHGFMLVMLHTSKEGGMACCRRLRELLEGSAKEEGEVRVYFGVTSTTDHQPTAQCLLRWAEQNLELAKSGKSGQIVAV